LGPPHSGPVRLQQQPPFTSLQHQILRPPSGGHGRDGSELVTREQLHQRPVQVTAADHQEDPTGEVPDHAHRPVVALSTVVSPSSSAGIRLLLRQPTVDHPTVANGKRRTTEESPVETTSLEDLWREHAYDWDLETRTLLEHALRPSTLKSYDSVLENFRVNAPTQKGNFQKGLSMCHLFSLSFFLLSQPIFLEFSSSLLARSCL